ncbi:MAG: type II secretion system F family protein [Acidobacteriaceae bacterium]|nr:type II secretion system F family protein [Acidobacteriaceae bacterium]
MILIPLIVFLVVVVITCAFGYQHYVRPSRLLRQLTASSSDALPVQLTERHAKPKLSASRLLSMLGALLPVSPQDAAVAKEELSAAGFRSSSAVAVYYGSKICLAMICLLIASGLRQHLSSPVLRIVMPIGSAAFGWTANSFILGRLALRRKESIRLSLPDVLDLMVICSEAGCGLDQAILNVSRDLKLVHPAISEELTKVNMEIMAGKSRSEALRNLGKRTGEEEVKKLVAILIQTDRFGTSVSEALRTQSEFLRMRRRQEAEERAGKVGVKLVFPIFFFCLPSLMVVTAGPGMLQLFKNLFPMMNSMGH